MSESAYSNAMMLCGYVFHCIHEIESKIKEQPVAKDPMPILVAAFFVPLSFTALHPKSETASCFYECVAARLGVSQDSPSMRLFFNSASEFIEYYGSDIPVRQSMDFSFFLAFSTVYDFPEDKWFDEYSDYAHSVLSSAIVFADKLIGRNSSQTSKPSAPSTRTKSTHVAYWIAVVAVVIAVIAIIVAVSSSHSARSAPEVSAASSPPVVESASAPTITAPEPEPDPQPEKLSLPRNGRHYPTYDFSGDAQSSICVHAPSTSNCFVIIKRSSTGKILDRFFVRSGSTVDTYCPKGTLDIYFTFGGDWYGTDLLFGEDTRCQVDREIEFTEAIAYEYTLNPVTDGNLHMPEVSIDEALSD